MRGRDPLPLALALMTLYALAVVAALALALRSSPGAVASDLAGGASATVRPLGQTVTFRVEPGMSAAEIAGGLAEAGVIADRRRFDILLELTGWGPELRAGRYEFQRGAPALEVIRRLREGLTNEQLFTVPEGLRLEEIGELLEEQGIASIDDWEQALGGPPPGGDPGRAARGRIAARLPAPRLLPAGPRDHRRGPGGGDDRGAGRAAHPRAAR